jgi:flavin reductase (DIM6/NTAB) family NADH-FMN oxidoreductase RutF
MDTNAKKIALRMIPYGLYVLTAQDVGGSMAAATVNWVTQASFEPPLLVLAVKAGSNIHRLILESGTFTLNILGKGQGSLAFTFFKPVQPEPGKLSGEPYHTGKTGAPILDNAPAFLECRLVETLSKGDHSLFVGRWWKPGLQQIKGRPDERPCGWNLGRSFYGG